MIAPALEFGSETTHAAAPAAPPIPRAGYDALRDNRKRFVRPAHIRHEDDLLTDQDRRKLVAQTSDLYRNFSVAAWAIRQHLNYVSTFSFQCRTADEALNERVEELFTWWSRPANCHAGGRHSLARCVRLAECHAVLDGDVFFQLLDTADLPGRLNPIEADRIATPVHVRAIEGIKPAEWRSGVKTDAYGRALAWMLCDRADGGPKFNRTLRASNVVQHAFHHRFDQVRGVSPLTSAINALVDVYENFDLALAKAKVAQLFAMAIYRDAADGPVDFDEASGAAASTGDSPYADQLKNFGKQPLFLDLMPGDRAEFLAANTPSSEFREFTQTIIAVALKALDIPYSFYAENFTNYSGARQALLNYEKSAAKRRQTIQELLTRLWVWRMNMFVRDGDLVLPRGLLVRDIAFELIAEGTPWIDPLKEITAEVTAVDNVLATRTEICRRRGRDFRELVQEQAAELALMRELGVAPAADAPANAARSLSALAAIETATREQEVRP